MNEVLFFISILITYSSLLFIYRFFGKTGIYCWICFASVMANLVVVKMTTFFGLSVTLGNVLFASVFLAVDMLTELFGRKEADRAVLMGLICNTAFIVVCMFVLMYKPSEIDIADEAFRTIFSITPRVCIGSIASYALGNFFDVMIFDKFKKKHGDKNLWFRNNFSTIVSQLFDNFVLHVIAFAGILSFREITILSVDVWFIEIIAAVCDTPFLYLSKKKKSTIK